MDPVDALSPRRRRWLIARGLARASATAAVMVVLYFTLPLGRISDFSVLAEIVLVTALLIGMVVWQVRAILCAELPAIRAIEALAATAPLFLLYFAATYFILGLDKPANFSEVLSRSDALYLTVTIFGTVGFGDITPKTEAARMLVTAQMLLDLVVLGLGIRMILGAVKRAKAEPSDPTG
jgi:voltage-gated potassium channel